MNILPREDTLANLLTTVGNIGEIASATDTNAIVQMFGNGVVGGAVYYPQYKITGNVTYTLGTDAPGVANKIAASLYDACLFLSRCIYTDGTVVILKIPAGTYAGQLSTINGLNLGNVILAGPTGQNGTGTDISLSRVTSVTGGSGTWSVVCSYGGATTPVVGAYVDLTQFVGIGTLPYGLCGIWPVASVNTGAGTYTLTVKSALNLAATGAITDGTDTLSGFYYGAVFTGIGQVIADIKLGGITGIIFYGSVSLRRIEILALSQNSISSTIAMVTDGTAGQTLNLQSFTSKSPIDISICGDGVVVSQGSFINLNELVVAKQGDTGASGIFITDASVLISQTLLVYGALTRGFQIDTNSKVSSSSSTVYGLSATAHTLVGYLVSTGAFFTRGDHSGDANVTTNSHPTVTNVLSSDGSYLST